MNQKEKMKNDLLEEINSYYRHFVYLKDIHKVFDHLNKMQLDESGKQKLHQAPNFFMIVECGLIDSFMISLARLYDNSEDAKTIQALIKKSKRNISLFNSNSDVRAKLEEFENELDDADGFISSAIETIKHRRDKMLVHNDKKYFQHPEKDNSHLPMYKIWMLIDFTEKLLNYLLQELSSESNLTTKYNEDLDNLFKKEE